MSGCAKVVQNLQNPNDPNGVLGIGLPLSELSGEAVASDPSP